MEACVRYGITLRSRVSIAIVPVWVDLSRSVSATPALVHPTWRAVKYHCTCRFEYGESVNDSNRIRYMKVRDNAVRMKARAEINSGAISTGFLSFFTGDTLSFSQEILFRFHR